MATGGHAAELTPEARCLPPAQHHAQCFYGLPQSSMAELGQHLDTTALKDRRSHS